MAGKLEGKVAVITGGSRGLGLGIARALAREGAAVVVASRSADSVRKAAESLSAEGVRAAGFACDVADLARVEALAEFAQSEFGGLDIWVNNAGLSAPYGPSASVPSASFRAVLDTNIIGTYNGSVVALRHMLPRRGGRIVNILGRGDSGALPFQSAYSSSKVWARNFTRALAKEYSNSGIGIHGLNPGLVLTDMIGEVTAVRGWEGGLEPFRIIAAIWAAEASVPAAELLRLVGVETEGRTGIMAKVLTPSYMLRRLAAAGLRLAFGKGLGGRPMSVRVVEGEQR